MDLDKISVIIPTFNRKEVLLRTLEGYQNQTIDPQRFQLIVVDDGSNDGTYEQLQQLSHLKYQLKIFRQKNSGPNSARQLGLSHADFSLVLITGDDMVPQANFLEEHLSYHHKYPDSNFAVLGFIDWHPDVKLDSFKKYITEEDGYQFGFNLIQNKKIVSYQFFYTSNISLKKEFIDQFNYLFDPDFTYPAYDDIELGFRLFERGLQIVYNKKAIVYHLHDITVESFGQRTYQAGKMSWILLHKQPAEINIKKYFKYQLDIQLYRQPNFQQELLPAAKEINKIEPEVFKNIFIAPQKRLFDEVKKYQKTIFKNFIDSNFALGLREQVSQEFIPKKTLNIAIIPDHTASYSFWSRMLLPGQFFDLFQNVNIFWPQELSKSNLSQINVFWIQNVAIFDPKTLAMLQASKKLGQKVILDLDGPFWESSEDKFTRFRQKKEFLRAMVNVITVPTSRLKEKAENFFQLPALVIPTYIDILHFYYKPPLPKRKTLHIGLFGLNQPEHLEFVLPVIQEILANYPVRFRVWGKLASSLKSVKGVYSLPEEKDYLKYAHRLRNEKLDLGLVPEIESDPKQEQTNLRWLELSINKVPAIFSKAPAYNCVEHLKTGLVVENEPKSWIEAISLLLENDDLRTQIRENAYNEVLQHWVLSKKVANILKKIEKIL